MELFPPFDGDDDDDDGDDDVVFLGDDTVGICGYTNHLPAHRYHLAHRSPGHREHRETCELSTCFLTVKPDGLQRIATPKRRGLTSPATHDREQGIHIWF